MICGAYVPLGIPKYVWIDAYEESDISINILYINSEGIVLAEENLQPQYLDNNIWRATVNPMHIDGYVLGIATIDGIKDSFVLRYGNPIDRFFYRAPGFKSGENYEFIQLDENAETIDYGPLNEIGYGFYHRAINKKQLSIICVEDVCAVFKYPFEMDCSNYTSDKDLQKCLELKQKYYEKLLLLEKQLNNCLSQEKTVNVGTINVVTSGEASPITTETNIIKTDVSKSPITSDKTKINTTDNVKINSSLTSNINTRLK